MTAQQQLDSWLDRIHTARVRISPSGPLPPGNTAYAALAILPQNGFPFSVRQLIHAIGCKTASLPVSETDECLKSAWLYTRILDLEAPQLSFIRGYGADLQAARSQEIGIGMMCLIAERCFGIPWDQLGPLPGKGKRFDYRGTAGQLECIFESKGTSRIGNQDAQLSNGLEKKTAHHQRGEHFDVELITSFCIGYFGDEPQILLADPDKSSLKELFDRGGDRYFRLRHYCRVLQYVGLPRSAYHLNRYALDYLRQRRSIRPYIVNEKRDIGYLESVYVNGDEFLGRWFNSWLPEKSERYKKFYDRREELFAEETSSRRKIFQGIRRDIYDAGLQPEPFSQPLISRQETSQYRIFNESGVSVFPDGTIMIFRQE